MLRIGLTGGIAAGKSQVARRYRDLGAVVVDADVLARAALDPGSEGLHEVVAAFGEGVLGSDGALDRAALGRLVFADDGARERLNGIVHPRVRRGAAQLIDSAPDDAVVVEDIPLLVETGQAARFHLVVVVDAPDEVRVERMVEQRHMDRVDALQRINAQASRADRLREADAVLDNESTLEELLAAADALWHERIIPFRDTLASNSPAGIPTDAPADAPADLSKDGPRTAATDAGLAGTRGLTRRIIAKLEAALPEGMARQPLRIGAVVPGTKDGTSPGPAPDDDVGRTAIRVPLLQPRELGRASLAVAAAGFPLLEGVPDHAGPGAEAVHRSADPALEVTVLVAATHDHGTGPGD